VEQIRGSEGAGMTIDELKLFTDSYIYLSSPYSLWPRGQEDAAETVARLAARLITAELPIFSPIAHGHAIARAGGLDLHSPVWLKMDQFFCRWASVLLVADLSLRRLSLSLRRRRSHVRFRSRRTYCWLIWRGMVAGGLQVSARPPIFVMCFAASPSYRDVVRVEWDH
jgi:Domain of unknown function (DUF1937)